MRLPWPFGRARPDPATPPAPDLAADNGARSPAAANAAWRNLPPLTETIGPPPLVAPNRPFAAALAAENPPPPILAPLSHGRGLEAPRGLVVGIAKPTRANSGASTPPPVQRARRRPRAETETPVLPIELSEPTAAPVEAVRRLPIVNGASRQPAPSLTRSPDDLGPVVIPSGVVGSPIGSIPAPSRPVEAAIQRPPLSPETTTPVLAAPHAAEPAPRPLQPAAAASAASLPVRATLGQARRLGLGAPIASGPLGTGRPAGLLVPGRATLAPPEASSAPSPRQPSLEVAASPPSAAPPAPAPHVAMRSPEPPVPSPAIAAPAPAPSLGPRPAIVAPAPAPSLGPRPVPAASPSRGAGVEGKPARSAPLVSASPLRTRVQRAPLSVGPKPVDDTQFARSAAAGSPADQPATSTSGSVTVHRGPAASQLANALEARAFSHDSQIYLPASHGPLSSGPARSLLAHEMTHVAQQRKLGSSLPPEHTRHGQALEAEAVAAERSQGLPLAPSGGHGTRHDDGEESPPFPTPANAQRAVADSRPAPAATGSDETLTVQFPGGVQRAGMGSASPAGHQASEASAKRRPTDQELEDLARQLSSRIGRRLRRELLIDRERAGLVMDLP